MEARTAQHWTALRGFERNCGFGSAFRTYCAGFSSHTAARTGDPFDLALLATLGIILELLVMKEELLARGKDKIVSAIHAFQYLVNKLHIRT